MLSSALMLASAMLVSQDAAAPQRAAAADLTIGPGAAIQGQLVDAAGQAAGGRRVQLRTLGGQQIAAATADRRGEFRLAPVTPGAYVLTSASSRVPVRLWNPAAAPPTAGASVLIPVGAAVRGNLPNPGKAWLPGAMVVGATVATVVSVTTADNSGS